MLTVVGILLMLFLFVGRPRMTSKMLPHSIYMSRDRTTMINGLFVRHMLAYKYNVPEIDQPIKWLNTQTGQLIVAPFFFFSGYGIMISLQKKQSEYAKSLLFKRFPSLLLQMTVAVWIFSIVGVILAIIMYWLPCMNGYTKNIPCILFALSICMFFSCVSFAKHPNFLSFLGGGAGLFYLYIYQRIPMLIGVNEGWNKSPYLYELICILITFVIAKYLTKENNNK